MTPQVVILVICFASIFLLAVAVPGDKHDYRTGNRQLRDAVNAAIIRLKATGVYQQLEVKWNQTDSLEVVDSYCVYPSTGYAEVYPFPQNPAGVLKNILERGYIRMVTPGPLNEGPYGNYAVSPPVGFEPETLGHLAALIGANYGVPNLGVQFVFTNSSGGSDLTFEALLANEADSTTLDFLLSSTTALYGSPIWRHDVLDFSCSITTTSAVVTTLDTIGVSTFEELRALFAAHPEYVVGAGGTGSLNEAKLQLPNNQVIDYETLGYADSGEVELENDLISGKIQAIWGNSVATDEYYNPAGSYVQFVAPFLEPSGIFFRYDEYAPGYVAANQGSHGGGEKYERKGTTINFNFDGLLA